MPYEHERYEEEDFLDDERESALHEREPMHNDAANDNERPEDHDSPEQVLGGEPDDWELRGAGDSGYRFDAEHMMIIGPDGASWTDTVRDGESSEEVAIHDEMLAHFAAGEHMFQLPDHQEGETLYKTFMILNEDNSVSYEIHEERSSAAREEEGSFTDDERGAFVHREPPYETNEAPPTEQRDETRIAVEVAVAKQTEGLSETDERTAAPEALAPETKLTELIASVTYRTSDSTRTEIFSTPREEADVLALIPNLPTYASRNAEPTASEREPFPSAMRPEVVARVHRQPQEPKPDSEPAALRAQDTRQETPVRAYDTRTLSTRGRETTTPTWPAPRMRFGSTPDDDTTTQQTLPVAQLNGITLRRAA